VRHSRYTIGTSKQHQETGNTSVMSVRGTGFFGSGPIFRFAPGVRLQYQFQGSSPSRQIQITLEQHMDAQTNVVGRIMFGLKLTIRSQIIL
jgi:hypothetical protein